MVKVKIELDETQFGSLKSEHKTLCNFYLITNSKKEFITQRYCDPNNITLIAVSKHQFNYWKNQNIIGEVVEN